MSVEMIVLEQQVCERYRVVIAGATIVELLVAVTAAYRYPLVDRNVPLSIILMIFVPIVLARFAFKRKEVKQIVPLVVVGIFAAFLFLNGSLDTHPPEQIEARVIAKSVRYGKGSNYVLTVAPSWRDGRTEENLGVSSATYWKIAEAQPVQVTVHRGAFGLPWYSSVLPD
jgi:hypothetical protein